MILGAQSSFDADGVANVSPLLASVPCGLLEVTYRAIALRDSDIEDVWPGEYDETHNLRLVALYWGKDDVDVRVDGSTHCVLGVHAPTLFTSTVPLVLEHIVRQQGEPRNGWEGEPYQIILHSQDGWREVEDEGEDAKDKRQPRTTSPSASVHGRAATAVSLRRRFVLALRCGGSACLSLAFVQPRCYVVSLLVEIASTCVAGSGITG